MSAGGSAIRSDLNHWSRPPRSVPGGQWARNVPFFTRRSTSTSCSGSPKNWTTEIGAIGNLPASSFVLELRPARADGAGHGVPVDARRVQRRLGRVADPDRPLVDLDRGRRPLVGPRRRGPGAEAEAERRPTARTIERVDVRMGRLILRARGSRGSPGLGPRRGRRVGRRRRGRPGGPAMEAGVGPDHAVAGVLVRAEVDVEPELLRPPRPAASARFGGPSARRSGFGVELLAVGEDAAVDAPLPLRRVVEPDEGLERGVLAVEVVGQDATASGRPGRAR